MPRLISLPAYADAPPRRRYSATSSASNPDEDWTKISDVAERRRIQNRIAQRKYRKKLKRRLEDLECRAGSSGDAKSDKQRQETTKSKRSSSPSNSQRSQPATPAKPVVSRGQFTLPGEPSDDLFFTGTYDDRARSNSFSQFTYSTHPALDETLFAPYGSALPYPTMTTADAYANYPNSSTVPMMLSLMTHFSDTTERQSCPSDDGRNPYTTCGYMPPIDFNAPSPSGQSNPHVSCASQMHREVAQAQHY